MAKKKKSIYSRRLKDVNKDGKRNFGDTFLGDLLGADGKVGIGKGRPGLLDSLKGERREKPINKKPKAKPNRKKKDAKPNVRVGIKTSTSVVTPETKTNRRFDPSNVQPERKKTTSKPDRTSGTPSFRDRSKDVKKSDVPFADRVKDDKASNKAVPKDQSSEVKKDQSDRNSQVYVSPAVKFLKEIFIKPEKVDSVIKNPKGRNKTRTRSGNSKGGMIDYRKTGMFYGGMTKRGKK